MSKQKQQVAAKAQTMGLELVPNPKLGINPYTGNPRPNDSVPYWCLLDLNHGGTIVARPRSLDVAEVLVNTPRSEWAEVLYASPRG
jgi:hypothetical protein